MPITLREKEHWEERMTRKINQAIEALYAEENPHFLEEVREKAHAQALKTLGMESLAAKVKQIEQRRKRDDADRTQAYREMVAIVTGKSAADIDSSYCMEPREVANAIRRRANVHERENLQQTELGQRVLKLEQEKEELLDTVWLATSTTQIKQLWQTVADVLRQEPTELQQEALRIDAIEQSTE